MDEIETDRLYLRHFIPDDLDELAVIFSDPAVLNYLIPSRAATREETNAALLSMIRHWERHNYGRWAVIDRATNKLIGYGGLRCFDGTPELVYLLRRDYWGYGLATEIALGCLEYGFTRHRFERIIAVTQPGNVGSRRVMEKVGLSYERDTTFMDIKVVLYSITLESYLSRHLTMSAADSSSNLSIAGHK